MTLPSARRSHVRSATEPAAIRAVIYTRKSTDQGLERHFNSLDAQREAAEALIRTQAEQGWTLLDERYDDGGFSGANTDRPALQRLLADVEAGKLDAVVTYRLDRISRSLLDFLRIHQFLEAHGVALASVSESINTSTPHGRMMVNVLLSFAQYERELIGQRTHDKLAAARRRGKFTGGQLVLGYDRSPEGGRLLVNETEADRVRAIFDLYLEHEGLVPVVRELNRHGWATKTWRTKAGHVHQGTSFTKTLLHRLLTNIVYSGRVSYQGTVYPGEHDAIMPVETWERVQRVLQQNRINGGAIARSKHGALLGGLLRCAACGAAMIHAPTAKNGKLYRYYRCRTVDQNGAGACPTGPLRAEVIEAAVVGRIKAIGKDPAVIAATFAEAQRQCAERAPALAREVDSLRTELVRHHEQVGRLVSLVAEGGPVAEAARGQLAELQAAVATQEARLREAEVELASLESATVDEADLRRALEMFTPVWDVLLLPERSRILLLLIERVEYDGADGRVALTFRPTGIRALAAEARA